MLAAQVLETINPADIHVFDKVTNWRRLLQRWTGNKRQVLRMRCILTSDLTRLENLTFRQRVFLFFDDPLSSPEVRARCKC